MVKMEEIIAFAVMVIMEACTIALTIMAKTSLTGGMSPFVFIVYANALGSLLLLPYSFLFHGDDRTEEPFFSFPLIVRMLLLGFTGVFLFQNFAFLGLSYSSPIVVCAMGLQIPAISFLLSLALRRTKIGWRWASTRAKIMGTLVSFAGAMVEEFYRGPYIRPSPSSPVSGLLKTVQDVFVFYKAPDRWVLGGILLAVASLSICIWNLIQLDTVRKYPQVMKVVSSYSIAGTAQCVIFSVFMERDLEAWKIKRTMDLILIIMTGLFGSIIRTTAHVKFTKMKGPFYVPLFKPFGILWAAVFGTSFFVNSLQYGSVLGASIAGMGYLTVMWGQRREEEESRGEQKITKRFESLSSSFSSCDDQDEQKVPLLHDDCSV